MRIVDLTHSLENNMLIYAGLIDLILKKYQP